MANPVFEAVRTVLAVREYDRREIPDEVLHRIVEAGRLSGSSKNLQPWHFVVVRERAALEELGRLIRTGTYIADAAAAVVVAVEKASEFGVSDGSRAIQSMILTAWGEGVGSNWTGFTGMREVAAQVGLPDDYDVIGVIPFGYPRRAIGRGRKNRKAADQVISSERFGTPYRS
ncbi:MAG: nitroreductase family protein [Candidatus Dormibacteraeota bacterium]|nr:nitroreductase family protein [Candidatus Dormibacteraeota bacterium]